MALNSQTIEQLSRIRARDPRFDLEAYDFVRQALDYTLREMGKGRSSRVRRHVSGQELLEGIRRFALKEFGPITGLILEEWGVRRCEDFGDIVFNMVDSGILGKSEEDRREDFVGGYSFDEAFRRPFLPRAERKQTSRTGSPGRSTRERSTRSKG